MEFFTLFIGAILVNNFVLSKFLGICPFLGVSKNVKTALGMSGAVTFVMTIASLVAALVNQYVLIPFHLEYLQTISFIVIIASLVQILEVLLQKFSPPLYQALGIFLPLITTNCAVLGVAVLNAQNGMTVVLSTWYGLCSGLGFGLALLLFSSIRERLDLAHPPKAFEGVPLALVTAGILAMVFMGFSGLV
jgi:electron transport complex protein RnfA